MRRRHPTGMKTRTLLLPVLAIWILAGCSESEQSRARNKAREAGQELKEELREVKDEARKAGAQLKDELKDAGEAARRGIGRAGEKIKEGMPDKGAADRRKP